ncbi:MAG TPA: ATP-binding protein [Longimicrobiales bacterium]|nr:ATP-binding protein [Longimicrobiales bacterium]
MASWKPEGSLSHTRAAGPLAAELRTAKASITYRWLERVSDRVSMAHSEVFPSEDLLDHVPLLIDAIADYMEYPGDEGTAEDHVIAKSTELGAMRYRQGFSPYQILKEFEILGGVLLSFLTEAAARVVVDCPADEVLVCAHRVQQAVAKIQQTTAARHLALADEQSHQREERLRSVQRILSGDVRERLARATAAARELRKRAGADVGEDVVGELEILGAQLEQLESITQVDESTRQHRNVRLEGAVAEAVRRVRARAEAAGVPVRVRTPLPDVEVDGAGVELCLLAYLTNAIRYADRGVADAWVEVGARVDDERDELIVEVRDTGRALPPGEHTALFERFIAGGETVEEGQSGLGLSFVRETAAVMGGRAWAERAEDPPGSTFALALPCRRRAERGDGDPSGD